MNGNGYRGRLLRGILSIIIFTLSIKTAIAAVPPVVKVGVFNSYPLIFQDKDGAIRGLYNDLLSEISKEENIRFEYVFGTWQEGLERIRSGEVDMLTSVGYTEERARYMDYCRIPLLTVWGELYTLQSSNLIGLLELAGKKIGVLKGDIFYRNFHELITKFGIRCDLVEYESYEDVFKRVAAGEVDAGIVDVTFGTAKFREYKLRSSGIVFNPLDIFFTTAKNKNQDLRALLDFYLQKWNNQDSSVYSQAKQKWLYGSVGAVTVIPGRLMNYFIILGIIITAALVFIVLLKLQVKSATGEIMRREEALRESWETFRALTENSVDIISRIDINCRYLYINPAVEKHTGILPQNFIGKTSRELGFPGDLCELWDNSIKWVFSNGSVKRVLFQLPDGPWFDWMLMPEFNSSNEVIAVITSARDFTEYRKLEQQLQQAQKMEIVGTLAGGLAHDFNNILSGITGPLSLINHRLDKNNSIDNATLKRYIEMMDISCKRATEVIAQLLSISRKREPEIKPMDINISIRNVMEICENSFDKSIELRPCYFLHPAYIMADQTQIEQVLLNLCVNSSHAMTIMRESKEKWGGTLSITLEKITADNIFLSYHPEAEKRGYWFLSVSDSGVGIKPENIPLIFDPFFSTKDNGKGTGLGLALAYSIIKNHHGFITVYSEPGVGTAFNIYLPQSETIEAHNAKPDFKREIFRGEGTILVADDESNIRNIMKEFLEECGYNVLLAGNGRECIDIFIKNKPVIKAVILDMSMPEMSGKDAYLALRDIDPAVKVIISTGLKEDHRVGEIISLGVEDSIQKPVTLEILSKTVHRLLYGP